MKWRATGRPSAMLWIVLTLWLGGSALWRPLTLPDEGRYVGVALEMLRSGDWLVPTLDGLPYFHKPPLFYWITAAAMAWGGPTVLAARGAPLLSALAMAGFVWWYAARWLSREVANWAVVVIATMPFFVGASQYANLDLLVAACITGAIVCLADGLSRGGGTPGTSRVIAAAWVMMALGMLAKGLIGLVLPLAVAAGWSLQRRGSVGAALADARLVMVGIGPVLAALIVLPWFVAVERRHPGFVDYFIVEQHVRRYTTAAFNNPQPFWFYAPVIAGLTLPWFAFIGRGADTAMSADAGRSVRQLAWWWIGLVTVFFSWPRSKLIGYVLPVLPPLAMLLADRACRVPQAWLHAGRRRVGVAVIAATVCAVTLGAVARHHDQRNHQVLAAMLDREAAPGEPVYAVEVQPYDLAFHARQPHPLRLVTSWGDPALAQRDDWRKELADAARFDPTTASQVLLDHDAARRAWCASPVSWVIAAPNAPLREPALRGTPPRALTKVAGLWRVSRDSLNAAGLCR